MIFDELESALAVFDKLKAWWQKRRGSDPTAVAGRFVRLFERHGIHRNQIPRVLGRGLTLANVVNDNALLPMLTDELLEAASQLFGIRRSWIEGATDQIYDLHDCYKQPERFAALIDAICARGNRATGVVLTASSLKHEEDALIIIEESVGAIDDRPIYRYHLCNNWIFKYWKSRVYLAACVAEAWRRSVYLLGRRVPISTIIKYKEGSAFLEYSYDSALPTDGEMWHPEDLLVKPSCFLEGLDEGKAGRILGLEFWLHMQEGGLLDTDLPYVDVRGGFERALQAARGQTQRALTDQKLLR